MKTYIRLLALSFLMTSTTFLHAQEPAQLLHEVEDLPACESAVYDINSDLIYTSFMGDRVPGDGGVAIVSADGRLINKNFITGLEDPKGIAITADRLYVSDVTVLVEADKKTGEILKKHALDDIEFLNDVALAPNGDVYVTDTRASKIFKLDTHGNFSLWLDDARLDNPNGILIRDNQMYIASWGSSPEGGAVSLVDMTTKTVTSISEKIGNLDGIRPFDTDHLIISDWRSGKVSLIDLKTGGVQPFVQVGQSIGDIAYIPEKEMILLPMNKQKRLLIYKMN